MLKACKFKGFDVKVVKNMAIQLLIALRFLKKTNIIHCDLKPENILLKYYNKSMIKVIDFGSSCLCDERLYTYIQSRFYRAPEIILGLPYDYSIDIWSFGCIICELITGQPIFAGDSENDQFACFLEVLGLPPEYLVEKSSRKNVYFEEDNRTLKIMISKANRKVGTKSLETILGSRD